MRSANRLLIFILIFSVVISTASVFYAAMQAHHIEYHYITGLDTSDIGFVNLTISRVVNIDVSPSDAILDFGGCAPGENATFVRLDNNVSEYNESLGAAECTGDNGTIQVFSINNIGNEYANVSVLAECNGETLIGGTGPQLNFTTTGCFSGDLGWTEFSNSSSVLVCANFTPLGIGGDVFNFSAGALIPPDAIGGVASPCNDSNNMLTFTAQGLS